MIQYAYHGLEGLQVRVWRFTSAKLNRRDAQAPHIRLAAKLFPHLKNFRRYPVGSHRDAIVVFFSSFARPKIRSARKKANVTVGVDENFAGLYVSVGKLLLVQVLESLEGSAEYRWDENALFKRVKLAAHRLYAALCHAQR
jgi:hypothetical protein